MTDEQFTMVGLSLLRQEALLEEILLRMAHPKGATRVQREAILSRVENSHAEGIGFFEEAVNTLRRKRLAEGLRSQRERRRKDARRG